jgi:hypothetical protein
MLQGLVKVLVFFKNGVCHMADLISHLIAQDLRNVVQTGTPLRIVSWLYAVPAASLNKYQVKRRNNLLPP